MTRAAALEEPRSFDCFAWPFSYCVAYPGHDKENIFEDIGKEAHHGMMSTRHDAE